MFALRSMRVRLIVAFWLLVATSILVPLLIFRSELRQEVKREAEQKARQLVSVAEWLLLQQRDQPNFSLQPWCVEAGKSFDARITYISLDGTVLADSSVPAANLINLDNHASRPEIVQAREQGGGTSIRFSATIQRELIYAARKLAAGGGLPPGYLRIAVPVSPLMERAGRLTSRLLLFCALVLALSMGCSYLLARHLERPIRTLDETIKAIGAGDYSKRVRHLPGVEFQSLAEAINRMAAEIEAQMQAVSEQKERLQATFDAMKEGVMVLDHQGRIQAVNRAFTEMVKVSRNPRGRRPLEVILQPQFQDVVDAILQPSTDDSQDAVVLQVELGEERQFDVTVAPFHPVAGQIGAIAVFHDISEIKRLERIRRDFVANVSHELRTPLTSIKGYTETLLAQPQMDRIQAQRFLQVIANNTELMIRLVDDLLQLSRLEAQPAARPAGHIVNLRQIIETSWEGCQNVAHPKDVRLEAHLPEQIPPLEGDAGQFQQVFRNLFENACRYSPKAGAVTVFCQVAGDRVVFQIVDQGPGIPRQHQQRIFERFYRVEQDRSTISGSTGLGLAICKHIVQNHGGDIWVESPAPGQDRGAAFFFSWPSAQPKRDRQ